MKTDINGQYCLFDDQDFDQIEKKLSADKKNSGKLDQQNIKSKNILLRELNVSKTILNRINLDIVNKKYFDTLTKDFQENGFPNIDIANRNYCDFLCVVKKEYDRVLSINKEKDVLEKKMYTGDDLMFLNDLLSRAFQIFSHERTDRTKYTFKPKQYKMIKIFFFNKFYKSYLPLDLKYVEMLGKADKLMAEHKSREAFEIYKKANETKSLPKYALDRMNNLERSLSMK